MTVVNLKKEVVSTLKETKQTVLTAIESGNRNVFVIGDALYSAFTKCLDERKEHQRQETGGCFTRRCCVSDVSGPHFVR